MMECACIVDADIDGAPPEFLNEECPVAQKEHKCTECGRIIHVGEEYLQETGRWGGRIATYKTCTDCSSIRRELVCNFWYGMILEDLRETIRDCGGDVSEDCLAPLTPRARAMVCEMIEEAWEGMEEDDDE